jgi:hypothetical protein
VALVEGRDPRGAEASGECDQGRIGQAEAQLAVALGDLDALGGRRTPPLDGVCPGREIPPEAGQRPRPSARGGQVIELGQNQGSRGKLRLVALVPRRRLGMSAIAAVEQRVDERRVGYYIVIAKVLSSL